MEEFLWNFMMSIKKSNTIKLLGALDSQVSRNVKAAEIETRPAKSNGLWCCVLLPTVLITYCIQFAVSPLYKLVAFKSVALMFYCILFIVFLSISFLILQESIYGGCMATSFIALLLMYTILGYDLVFAATFAIPTVFSYSWLLRTSLNIFQRTFTIGEAMVLAQAVTLFTVMAVAKLTCDFDKNDHEDDSHDQREMDFIYTVIYTVLSTVGLIVTALYLLKDERRDLMSLGYIIGSGAAFVLLMLMTILGCSSPIDILHFIFIENDRYQIFTFWLVVSALAVGVLAARTQLAVKASTVTRKAFHVLASVVFMSGIVVDVRLMILAAGIVFGVLILVEALRKSNIEPISSALQSAFLVYSDEKDSGCLAVTPIYLYLGLACPLALVPWHNGYELELLSGVLSIGVGDTAASWFGSKYGFNKWSGGNRTYEGTVFNILSQVATVYALLLFELLDANNALLRTGIAATVTGLVEAKTNQVDNLVLPLVMLIAFQATWFLR